MLVVCILRPVRHNPLTSLYTFLYVAFVYLKLGCLRFLCALSASSVYPNTESVMRRPTVSVVGRPSSLFFLTLKATNRKMSKAATCHISFNTQRPPVMSHCLAWMLLRGSAVFTPHRQFSWFWGQRFPAFVCIAVRRAKLPLMMSSHSCEVVYMCAVFVTVSMFHAVSTQVEIFYI